MSEPPDALFGVDGTQPPEPLPNPWTGLGPGTPEPPLVSLPPLPDLSAMRETIAAAYGDDPNGPVDADRAAATADPAEPGGPPAAPVAAPVPQPGGSPAPQPGGSPAAPALRVAGQSPASGEARSSPLAPPLFPSTQSRPRRTAGLRYRPPMAAAFRKPVPPANLHGRVGRDRPGVPRNNPGNLALGAGLVGASIIIAVLVYYIVTGFLESMSRLIP